MARELLHGLQDCPFAPEAREKSEQAPAALNEDMNQEEVKGEDKTSHQMQTCQISLSLDTGSRLCERACFGPGRPVSLTSK